MYMPHIIFIFCHFVASIFHITWKSIFFFFQISANTGLWPTCAVLHEQQQLNYKKSGLYLRRYNLWPIGTWLSANSQFSAQAELPGNEIENIS